VMGPSRLSSNTVGPAVVKAGPALPQAVGST
jgi:hypothetical protein